MRPSPPHNTSIQVALLLTGLLAWSAQPTAAAEPKELAVGLQITSTLTYPNTPMSVTIDFADLIRQRRIAGVLDSNSIRVINSASGQAVRSARTEDFAYSDRGRIEWVVASPEHTTWSIRFRTVDALARPPLQPADQVPAVGVGDLLRYNSGTNRPITSFYSAELHDLTGDGRPDLVGSWNYAYRDRDPWAAPILYPALETGSPTRFGDLQRLRYFEPNTPETIRDLHTAYSSVDCVDFNSDGRLDLLYLNASTRTARILLGTTRRQPGGVPLFQADRSISVPRSNHCQAVDLDGDNDLDLVFASQWLQNTADDGWPLKLANPVQLDLPAGCAFADLDSDGRLDAIHSESPAENATGGRLLWRRRLATVAPTFQPPVLLKSITESDITMVSASTLNDDTILCVQHDAFQQLTFYRQLKTTPLRFVRLGRAESPSAVLALSDQAWPCLCDWDGDGDQDLLVGGGYGWPRVVINHLPGSPEDPLGQQTHPPASQPHSRTPQQQPQHGLLVPGPRRLGQRRTQRPALPQRDQSHLLVPEPGSTRHVTTLRTKTADPLRRLPRFWPTENSLGRNGRLAEIQ